MRINKKYIKRCIELTCHKISIDQMYISLSYNLIGEFLKDEVEIAINKLDNDLIKALTYISDKKDAFTTLLSKLSKTHLNKGHFYANPFNYKNFLRMAKDANWNEYTFEGRDFWLCPACSEFYTVITELDPKIINFYNLLDFASRNINK